MKIEYDRMRWTKFALLPSIVIDTKYKEIWFVWLWFRVGMIK